MCEPLQMIDWETCKGDFRRDGALRDIYISSITLADWQKIYIFFLRLSEAKYTVDGESRRLPSSIEEAFETRETAAPLLTFEFKRITFCCHFFAENQMEVDFLPQDITSQADLDNLLDFVKNLGDLTGKQVLVTEENQIHNMLFDYLPSSGQFKHYGCKW